MITVILSREARRTRAEIYDMFSVQGKVFLAQLLDKELELIQNFELTYESPELRKLAMKAKRGQASEEEINFLEKSKKSFQGRLTNGTMVDDAEAVKLIQSFISFNDIIKQDAELLNGYSSKNNSGSEIVLGQQMSYWNLHANRFPIEVYNHLFVSPEYTRNELTKVLKMRHLEKDKEPPKILKNKAEALDLLLDAPYPEHIKETMAEELAELRLIGSGTINQYKYNLTKVLNHAIKLDLEFDIKLYLAVNNVLPQYHSQNTRGLIRLLNLFNHDEKTSVVNERITDVMLTAFYRKAEELCY